MKRARLLNYLARRLSKINLSHPIRVAIDGADAAGKTVLADKLASTLQTFGRSVIRASIDGFHHPSEIRYKQGKESPEGYFRNSFDYGALIKSLLEPLSANGSRKYRAAIFDYRTNSKLDLPLQTAKQNAVLLFDGVFLQRPELIEHWDFKIFLESSFKTTLQRAEKRDLSLFGNAVETKRRYLQRYIPAQKIYFKECRPQEQADIVIDNNDPQNPFVL
jgi:uridine kinase